MKILIVNTYDLGGAANSAIRLHQSLLKNNISSKLLLLHKTEEIPYSFSYHSKVSNSLLSRVFYKLLSPFKHKNKLSSEKEKISSLRPKGLEYYSLPESSFDITQHYLYKEADVINLHWVADFLDWETFFVKNKKPLVWTLHDQNPFLGGEHYIERFNGINDIGYPIERVYSDEETRQENKLILYKYQILNKVELINIVTPSKWLANASLKSKLFNKFPHHVIPYGLSCEIFKTLDQFTCRKILNIDNDKIIVLFVADSIENNRKGYIFLEKAIESLPESYKSKISNCVIGQKIKKTYSVNTFDLGKIKDPRLMAIAYNAVDVFILPSLEDNLPNTIIESLMCGTPTISFNSGGISELVTDERFGYLCEEISVTSLKRKIMKFIDNKSSFIKEDISKRTREKFDENRQAKAYIDLYKTLY